MAFERINFFDGLFTTADDWKAVENYHTEKRKLHNKCLHGPGVIDGFLENLDIREHPDGNKVDVRPGCALDANGRELHLAEVKTIEVDQSILSRGATVYISIEYAEALNEKSKREIVGSGGETNYAFVTEQPGVRITEDPPDNKAKIELARILISAGGKPIHNASRPRDPGENEIDKRFVQMAGKGITYKSVARTRMLVRPSSDPGPSKEDISVLLDSIPFDRNHPEAALRSYVAAVYPEEPARIWWRIESSFEAGRVDYRLVFENMGNRPVWVYYRVRSLDF